jgi:hypothetical protein
MFVSMSSCNFTGKLGKKTTVSVSFVISSGSDLIDVSGRRSSEGILRFLLALAFSGVSVRLQQKI